jgi:lipoyl(octanoyl) transferase
MDIQTLNLGRTQYKVALERQHDWFQSNCIGLLHFEPEAVITLGLRSHDEQTPPSVPVLKVDRGGEATYHGHGQAVFFPAIHLPSAGLGVRDWVKFLLTVTHETVSRFGIPSQMRLDTPGLFTRNGKLAAIGLKIQKGWNRHGLALNVKGDLLPFEKIRPCGVPGAKIDQISHWRSDLELEEVAQAWCEIFRKNFA